MVVHATVVVVHLGTKTDSGHLTVAMRGGPDERRGVGGEQVWRYESTQPRILYQILLDCLKKASCSKIECLFSILFFSENRHTKRIITVIQRKKAKQKVVMREKQGRF